MNKYKSYTAEELEEHNSNYLISSISYSKADQFSRNPKAFEMIYLYGYRSKSSSTSVSGKAYHEAHKRYWKAYKVGEILTLPELCEIAYEFIEAVPANEWKIQKTTPTVAEAKIAATKKATQLIENFYTEKSIYEDHIAEILAVEIKITEYLTINGVDIPLPFVMIIDLVFKSKENKIIIVDHKSRISFTDEKEIALVSGDQAITYVKGYEAYSGLVVDEVWFAENKSSKNKDSSQMQLKMFPIIMDYDTRILHEVLLYEPIKKMIEAVSDPDFLYIINKSDNYVDLAELLEFWSKTQINEVDEFDIDESKRDLLAKRHRKIRDSSIKTISPKIIKNFQANAASFIQFDLSTANMEPQKKIELILKTFGVHTQVAHSFSGFSSNTFLLEVASGTKISSIQNYKLEIANALDVPNVRIPKDLKVYEGKSYLALDYAKKREQNLLWDADQIDGMKLPLGKDNLGQIIYWDLKKESTPNKFTTGSTGSGKSVNMISDLEYALLMDDIKKVVIFDPKLEFTEYSSHPKVTIYNDYLDIENGMKNLVDEMNQKIKDRVKEYVFVLVDEYADILGNMRKGKELDIMKMVQDGYFAPKKMMGIPMPPEPKMKLKKVGQHATFEENFMLLSQKGRSTGFRIDAATQISTADILTTKIKVNYPVIVCFRMPKADNSRVALDESGAEILSGEGDGLIKSPSYPEVTRFQAFFKPQTVNA